MYNQILNYGKSLKEEELITPAIIIMGFMSTKSILELKKELYEKGVTCKKYVENSIDCLERLRQSTDDQDIVYYTLQYIKFRNPMVTDIISDILGGMF